MSELLNGLGIYTNAIETHVQRAIDFVNEVQDFLSEQGYGDSEDYRLFSEKSLKESVDDEMGENFNPGDITNSLIRAYYGSIEGIVNSSDIMQNVLRLECTFEANCDASNLEMVFSDGKSNAVYYTYSGEGDFKTAVCDVLTDRLLDAIAEENNLKVADLDVDGLTEVSDVAYESIAIGEITIDDIVNYIENRGATDEITEVFDRFTDMFEDEIAAKNGKTQNNMKRE